MARIKVLIVDDQKGFTHLLRMNLEESGEYEVKVENEGRKAADAARWWRPDVILLDVIMPDISGREVAEQLAGQPETADTPVVFLTAAVSRDEAQSIQGEMDGHRVVCKPAPIEEVVAAIQLCVAQSG